MALNPCSSLGRLLIFVNVCLLSVASIKSWVLFAFEQKPELEPVPNGTGFQVMV